MPKQRKIKEAPQVYCFDCGAPLGRSWRSPIRCSPCLAKALMEVKTHPLRPRPAGLEDDAAPASRPELDELGFPVGY